MVQPQDPQLLALLSQSVAGVGEGLICSALKWLSLSLRDRQDTPSHLLIPEGKVR